MYTHIHAHMYTHACTHIHIYIYIHIYTYMYIHTYISIHMHTCVHTYVHILDPLKQLWVTKNHIHHKNKKSVISQWSQPHNKKIDYLTATYKLGMYTCIHAHMHLTKLGQKKEMHTKFL